ncbi:hypothetical protein BS47DRAFT_1369725 [Hydnum rufescens UP504]|uniref:Uncharacterized protein n=1 Tax=Hydnum rufescens UP504 TaxID=1448309 RepID=A0A9P6ACE6_9AGAM|nr:hypothetical protein BS47DRAFT_1369725 [Hydnum rufescens UP504]
MPLPLPLALPHLPPRPLHLFLDSDVTPPCPVAPVRHPPCPGPSYRRSAPVPLSLVLSPCLENPQEHLGVCLFPQEATGSPQGSKNGDVILLHHCGTIRANKIGTEPPNRPDRQGGCLSPFDIQLEGDPLCLHGAIFGRGHHHVNDALGPHNDTPVADSAKTMALPISTKTIPVARSSWAVITAKSRAFSSLFASPTQLGAGVLFDSLSGRTIVYSQAEAESKEGGAIPHILAGSLVNNQVESFQYKNDLVNCLGVTEVRYMQEAYINAHSMAEVKELLAIGPIPYLIPLDAIDEMLDYKRFPALIDPRPGPQQSRPMTSVEFDTEWLSRRLYSAHQGNPASVTIGMRRMEMQLITHKTPVKGTLLSFNLNIWPTIGGTMNSDIRQIARWAIADLSSSSVSSNLESFACTKVRPAW